MPYRPSLTFANVAPVASREPDRGVHSAYPVPPPARAALSLAPFLILARELAALFVPVQPRAEFCVDLERNLLAAARQQMARELLLCPTPATHPARDGRRWAWGAATVGSAVSLASIVALVVYHRRRLAA